MVAKSGKGWKLAASLDTLFEQVKAKYPGRNEASDGTIGDQSHANRKSDHNVRSGYCHALDLTHDPRNGFDSEKFANQILAAQDPRLAYVISNKKIGSGPAGPSPGKWRAYSGSNPHDHHCHISTNALGEKDGKSWNIGTAPVVLKSAAPAAKPVLRKTMHGAEVINLKALLKTKGIVVSQATDMFDNETFLAVQLFQLRNRILDDGVVGPQTWKALANA